MSIYSICIENDEQAMQIALQQAKKGIFITTPNPRVGCVIVQNKKIIGAGFTQKAGENHAELQALQDACKMGNDVCGAIVYVTLEPCNHFGRTLPCSDALIKAGIAKVVLAIIDPNPLTAGQGLKKLRSAGITVVCGVLWQQAYELNIGFFKRMRQGIPWVRMKTAISLDGKTALCNYKSKWITSKLARDDVHLWRARACGIITGIGTIQKDDPQLNIRAIFTPRQPRRIVIDTQLSILPTAKILSEGNVWIFTTSQDNAKISILENLGTEIIVLPNINNKICLLDIIKELGKREFNEIHVEAGARLNTAFILDNCVDELLIYLAPNLLGAGYNMFNLPKLDNLDHSWSLYFYDIRQIGNDLRILARFK